MRKITETEVKDDSGAIIISPGLKVRHKDSQYEYTVEDVIQSDTGVEVILRMPDEPRFEPEPETNSVLQAKSKKSAGVIYEYEVSQDSGLYYRPEEDDVDDELDMMSVSQEEFEKEYEVK